MTAALLTGIALGLASSAHCAAMCGPLVLTIGRRLAAPSRRAQSRYALLHHAGRVIVYAALALPAGAAGEMLAVRGFGRALAIASGVVLLLAAVSAVRIPVVDRFGSLVSAAVARAFAPALPWASRRPIAGALATGALNALLPCGLVYAALATAAAAGDVGASVLLMIGFGAGTSVTLVAIAVGAASIPASLRARLRPVGPIVMALAALVLIVRGAGAVHHPADPAPAPAVHVHH